MSQSPRDNYDICENLKRAYLPACTGTEDTKTKAAVPASGRLVVELNGDNQLEGMRGNAGDLEEQMQKLEFEMAYRSPGIHIAQHNHDFSMQDGDSASDFDEGDASDTSSLSEEESVAKAPITNWF